MNINLNNSINSLLYTIQQTTQAMQLGYTFPAKEVIQAVQYGLIKPTEVMLYITTNYNKG